MRPTGLQTVSCGYSTQRIPVKDMGSITHSTIIRSYLKLRGYGPTWGIVATHAKRGWVISESDGCAERLRAKEAAKQGERGSDRGLYMSARWYQQFYGGIFFLLSELDKELPWGWGAWILPLRVQCGCCCLWLTSNQPPIQGPQALIHPCQQLIN